MADMIKDGTGRGYLARVDSEKRLITSAVERSHISHHCTNADHADAFSAYFKHTTISGGAHEILGYIQYTGSNLLVLHDILVSTTTEGLAEVEIWSTPTGLSGGTDTNIINRRIGSSNLITATVKDTEDGSTPITATDFGAEILSSFLSPESPFQQLDLSDSIVLPKNAVVALVCESSSVGDKIRLSISMYQEPLED